MVTLTGGDAFSRKLRDIAAKVGKSGTLQVGFLEGATYPDGTSVPLVAFINEFGRTVKSKDGDYFQMPRPFFRTMIAEKSPAWGKKLGNVAKAADYDMNLTLQRMGEGIAGQLQASIRDLMAPPLAPSTIKAKGFSKPLIDTSNMLNSVSYQVEYEGTTTATAGVQMSEAALAATKANG